MSKFLIFILILESADTRNLFDFMRFQKLAANSQVQSPLRQDQPTLV